MANNSTFKSTFQLDANSLLVQAPRARLLFICIEGVFTAIFRTCFYYIMEPSLSGLMPWTRDTII